MISLIPTYLAEWANRLGHRQSTPDSPKIARGSTHGIRLRAWSESLGRPAVSWTPWGVTPLPTGRYLGSSAFCAECPGSPGGGTFRPSRAICYKYACSRAGVTQLAECLLPKHGLGPEG